MLFEVNKTDTRCYEEELKNRLPRRMIDIHTHSKVIESGQTGQKNDSRLVTWPSMVAKINPIEDLLETYRLMFPEQTVTPLLLPGIQPLERIDDLNAYTLGAAAREKVPSLLYTHPSLDPSELEETLKREKRQGIKVYLNNSPKYIPPNEIRIYDYLPPAHLEVLDSLGLIVMLHIPRAARLRDPVNLAQVLEIEKRYRNLHLILAHVGRAYCNEDAGNAFEVLKETERLVFDVSANTNAWIFARAIEAVGPERVLFGSDLPVARMRMKRICEDGFYINVVPKGVYGDVSADKHMREVEGKDAENLTFFLYEEIKAILNAADEIGLTESDLENLFYNNAKCILESSGFVL